MTELTKTEYIKLEIIKALIIPGKFHYTDEEYNELQYAIKDIMALIINPDEQENAGDAEFEQKRILGIIEERIKRVESEKEAILWSAITLNELEHIKSLITKSDE